MDLDRLKYAKGSQKKRKRVGRGLGSGHGGTACRGHKGQNSRSGGGVPPWFEGGQMPLQRRVPKRGFRNIFRKEYQIVNVADLEKKVTDNDVDPEKMFALRMIDKKHVRVKVLGEGELSKPLQVAAHAFSQSAIEKIEKAGGKVVQL